MVVFMQPLLNYNCYSRKWVPSGHDGIAMLAQGERTAGPRSGLIDVQVDAEVGGDPLEVGTNVREIELRRDANIDGRLE